MDNNKKPELSPNEQKATYKAIPESDMEEQAIAKARNAARSKSIGSHSGQTPTEQDGADEKMLLEDGKHDIIVNVGAKIATNEKQNGDAKLDIGEIRTAFVGLTKEELMKYANDPFWVRLRWFLFITFWLLWASMLLGAVMIIYAAPKCDPPPPRTWWQQGPLTEANHDATLDDFKSLKQKGVPGVIVDWPEDAYLEFNDTHPILALLKQIKDDTNVIIQLEPGNSQKWFELSTNKHLEFLDYYIWRSPQISSDNGEPHPPNNWINQQNQSSWTYSEVRKEYYYTPHGKPHLNFRHPKVVTEFSTVIKRFIGLGAAGVRLKNVPYLLVDSNFDNQTISQTPGYFMNDYGFYKHTKTENLPELANLLLDWRLIVKNLTDLNGPFMASEDLHKIESYKIKNTLVIDLPLVSHLFTKTNLTASDIVKGLESVFTVDGITWPLWKYNTSDVLDIITFLLPGSPLIKNDAVINSELLKIRQSPSIMRGSFTYHQILNNTVFAFNRMASGNPGTLVAFNPTDGAVVVDFPLEIPAVSEEVTVQLLSSNYQEPNIDVNVKQDAHNIPISPKAAIVLSYVPKTS